MQNEISKSKISYNQNKLIKAKILIKSTKIQRFIYLYNKQQKLRKDLIEKNILWNKLKINKEVSVKIYINK